MFSAAKSRFGENLMATSGRVLTVEALQRMWAYDLIASNARERAGATI